MFYKNTPIKLADSRTHGAGTELFIVEGDSAANTIAALRNSTFQAVLPMQGKPLNAIKASPTKAKSYNLFQMIEKSLGITSGQSLDLNTLRFERIILLFDPDADGIHCGALMLMYFYKYMRPLLEAQRIEMVHAPWLQMTIEETGEIVYAYSEAQGQNMFNTMRAENLICQTIRYRGLAGIDREILMDKCIEPATRFTRVMGVKDAEMAIEVFGGIKL